MPGSGGGIRKVLQAVPRLNGTVPPGKFRCGPFETPPPVHERFLKQQLLSKHCSGAQNMSKQLQLCPVEGLYPPKFWLCEHSPDAVDCHGYKNSAVYTEFPLQRQLCVSPKCLLAFRNLSVTSLCVVLLREEYTEAFSRAQLPLPCLRVGCRHDSVTMATSRELTYSS